MTHRFNCVFFSGIPIFKIFKILGYFFWNWGEENSILPKISTTYISFNCFYHKYFIKHIIIYKSNKIYELLIVFMFLSCDFLSSLVKYKFNIHRHIIPVHVCYSSIRPLNCTDGQRSMPVGTEYQQEYYQPVTCIFLALDHTLIFSF